MCQKGWKGAIGREKDRKSLCQPYQCLQSRGWQPICYCCLHLRLVAKYCHDRKFSVPACQEQGYQNQPVKVASLTAEHHPTLEHVMKEIEVKLEELKALSSVLSSGFCPRPTIIRMPTSSNEAEMECWVSETEEKPVMEKGNEMKALLVGGLLQEKRLVNSLNLDRDSCNQT